MAKLEKRYKLKYEKIVWGKLAKKYVFILIDASKVSFYDTINSLHFTSRINLDILDGLLMGKPSEEIIKSLSIKHKRSITKVKIDFLSFLNLLKELKVIL